MATKTQKKPALPPKGVSIKVSDMTQAELTKKASEVRAQIGKIRLETKVGKTKNLRSVFNLRKDLARILTALRSKMAL